MLPTPMECNIDESIKIISAPRICSPSRYIRDYQNHLVEAALKLIYAGLIGNYQRYLHRAIAYSLQLFLAKDFIYVLLHSHCKKHKCIAICTLIQKILSIGYEYLFKSELRE